MSLRKESPGCIAPQMKLGTLCGRLTCDMMIELRGFVIAAAQTQVDPSRNKHISKKLYARLQREF
jgi:hypothetical protein